MKKEEFEFIKGLLEVRPGGVKEACLIVKEYLSNLDDLTKSAVTKDEYIEAVNILINYSFENSDKNTMIEEFYCKEDCRMNTEFNVCKGKFSTSNKGKKLCKYYMDPNK